MSAQEKFSVGEAINPKALEEPIPDLSVARTHKEGYRNWPIDPSTPYFKEELIDVAEKSLAGQAYYSRPNATTGGPIQDVPEAVCLRLTVADKLSDINSRLQEPFFASFFGGPVQLYVEDGLRPTKLQERLYEQTLPDLIRRQNPNITQKDLELKLKDLIAEPSTEDRPSPHATGGAADVILRYRQGVRNYTKDSRVMMGYQEGDTSKRTYPDYFELFKPASLEDQLAQKHRRAFYAVMTGTAFGIDTGLQVNPTEWWHWSYGDQMWAKLRHEPVALYGAIDIQT